MHGLFDLVDLWKQAGDRLAAAPARLLRGVPETPPGIDYEGSGANCKSPSGATRRPPQGAYRPPAGRCGRGAATLGALLFAVSCGAAQVTPRPVTPRGELPADERATVQLFERAKATVVFISTRERRLDPWTRNVFSAPKGTGSGFIWDAQGHVVTNYHVIAGASEARIRLADGRDYAASLAGASP
ncbi:MAG: serine protease, partial [Rhodocyclaceae bacterium]|nr:serine protease [Rhodocyclaceae bacterium]